MLKSEKIKESIFWYIHNGELEYDEQVKVFEHLADILGVKTLSQYAKDKNISYQGARKHDVKKVKLNGITLIIDNE